MGIFIDKQEGPGSLAETQRGGGGGGGKEGQSND